MRKRVLQRSGIAIAVGIALLAPPVVGEPGPLPSPPGGERLMARVLRQAFPGIDEDWRQRLTPDATMATCSAWNNQPPKEQAVAIKAREKLRIEYPTDNQFMGDWRRGEQIARSGYGLRFGDYPPKRPNGGNCYACHRLAPGEVSYGTLGVSLLGYGRIHKFRPEDARVVYEKIYNSQAIVACSLMPRFGANGVLTIGQIKDLVAYLMDPASPVNAAPERPSR